MSSQISYDTTAWNEGTVKDYLTATSREKDDPEKFYDTHLNIDEIAAEFLGGSYEDESVSQEEFRDEILSGDVRADEMDRIRIYVLRGETGSGKSQLCQWLDYELQGLGEADDVGDRVPLHIKANETSLEQIISTLAEPLGIDPQVDQVTDLDAGALANGIVANIKANPGPKLRDVDLDALLDPNGGDLESLLKGNIEDYQDGLRENSDKEFDPNLISNDDYRNLKLKLGTQSEFHTNGEVLRQALRDEIHRHFSHLIGVDDFQGQLRDYTKRINEEENKRPVIICEDVTTFSVLKEQLLDQIIQVEDAAYDIVLGYTTGFEDNDLQDALGSRGSGEPLTYLKDRAEGYLSLTDDGEATFLDDALSVELVKKYLNVIKRESGGHVDEDLESGFDDLYPFNKAFIRRVYQNLLDKNGEPRRTPRVLLQKVVRRCLLASEPPHEVVEKSTNVDSVVPAIDTAKYSGEAQKVATWYGVQGEGEERMRVSRTVLETFGGISESSATTTANGMKYDLFETNPLKNSLLGEMGGLGEESGDGGQSDKEKTEGEDEEESEDGTDDGSDRSGEQENSQEDISRRKRQIKQFEEWVTTGDSYDSAKVLKSGAIDILDMWFDPTRLANPNASTTATKGIYYTRGQDAVPVSIQGPDERDGLDVMLPFGEIHIDLYRQILQFSLEGEIPEQANAERLRSWATDKVVSFRGDIRQSVEACLPDGLTIEHCLLLAQYFLRNGEFGEIDFDDTAVFAGINLDDRAYDNPIPDALGRNHALSEALDDLYSRKREVAGLIEGFFLLKSNLVDSERLEPVRRDIAEDPTRYLKLAQQIDTQRLDYPSAFEIGNTRKKANVEVTTFLDAVSDFAVELELFGDDDLTEYFEDPLEAVEKWYDPTHSVNELVDIYDRFNDCMGTFSETEKESWENVYQVLTDESTSLKLTEFQESVDDFFDPNPSSAFERMDIIHRFAESQDEHHAWEIYATFDEMIKVLDDYEVEESTDLIERVRELERLDEFESNRSDVHSALETY